MVSSSEQVLSVGAVEVCLLLDAGKVQEMRRPVNLVVKLLRVGQREVVLHGGLVPHAHEVVVPGPLRRDHEEAEESVGQEHLDFLVVARQVALRVVALVGVVLAPLEAAGGQFVGRQRTRSGGEGAEIRTLRDRRPPIHEKEEDRTTTSQKFPKRWQLFMFGLRLNNNLAVAQKFINPS